MGNGLTDYFPKGDHSDVIVSMLNNTMYFTFNCTNDTFTATIRDQENETSEMYEDYKIVFTDDNGDSINIFLFPE